MPALILGEEIKKRLMSLLSGQKGFSAERRTVHAKHAKCISWLLVGRWAKSWCQWLEVWN